MVHGTLIESIQHNPGIYFDPVGSLKIINGYLDVVIPVDISFIQPHIKNINGVIGTSKYLCRQVDAFDELECHNIFLPLQARYTDIIRDYDSISHLILRHNKRSAWFGVIGTVFKHLFGTMNQDDAILYNNAIQTVENDQKEISRLMKSNILVTTSALSSFKEVLNKMNANEQSLNSVVDKLTITLKNLTVVSDKLAIRSKILELSSMIENSLLTLSFKLEDIINAIMFSKSNILYPAIITPKQLFNDLVDNYRFLPSSKTLPVSLVLDHIHTLMNISEISSYYIDNKIVFILKIPLVNPRVYHLYHSIPLPVAHGNFTPSSYSMILPTTKYISVTRDKAYYCKLDSLKDCRIINNQFYICNLENVYSTSATPICESEILTKAVTSKPQQCKAKFISGTLDIWQKLRNNKWIYIITQKSKLSVDCHNNSGIIEFDIIGTGILHLPNQCIGYYKDTQLIPLYSTKIDLKPVQLNFDLINDTCCNYINFKKTQSEIPLVNLENINLESLYTFGNLQTIRELDRIQSKPHIVQYQNHYFYITLVIILVIVSYLLYKIVKFHRLLQPFHCFNKNQHDTSDSTPSPTIHEETPIPTPRLRSQ